MGKTIIKQANNNKERQQTYTAQMGRYRKAMNAGFYFEALLIVYSLQEDRLKSFLYYSGVLQTRSDLNVSKKTKQYIRSIVDARYGEDKKISLKNISGKIELASALLNWVLDSQEEYEEGSYYYELKSLIEDIDVGGMIDTLRDLTEWIKYRNEVIHASMNKNIEDLYENLPQMVEKGMEYARYLDSQVKIMKRSNRVRKSMKMQNN